MPTLDDVSRIDAGLPGGELRELMMAEPMVGVKVASSDEQRAYLYGWPDVFRASGVSWGGPKVLFRLELIDPQLLLEIVIEAWRSQAPRYLRKKFDDTAD